MSDPMDLVMLLGQVGVELRVVHFTDEYWNLVVSFQRGPCR